MLGLQALEIPALGCARPSHQSTNERSGRNRKPYGRRIWSRPSASSRR